MKYDVFISHSHRDRAWSRRLAESLRKRGMQVWFDEEQLTPGIQVNAAIRRGMAQSSWFLTVLDPADLSRPNVLFEAGMAVGLGKKVLFVIPETHTKYPAGIKTTTWIRRGAPEETARRVVAMLASPERSPESSRAESRKSFPHQRAPIGRRVESYVDLKVGARRTVTERASQQWRVRRQARAAAKKK